ncbi:hypothetical protein [Streptomyces sp. NPDC006285]
MLTGLTLPVRAADAGLPVHRPAGRRRRAAHGGQQRRTADNG